MMKVAAFCSLLLSIIALRKSMCYLARFLARHGTISSSLCFADELGIGRVCNELRLYFDQSQDFPQLIN